MTRWDTENLNAAHTQRELDQEWGQVMECEIGSGNVFADLGFENADVMALQSENKGLRDRIEQLERELAWARGEIEVNADAVDGLEFLWRETQTQLASERVLADQLYRVNNTFCTNGDRMDANHAYRKARGL